LTATYCITGATGFIGQRLVERLCRHTHAKLRLLQRRSTADDDVAQITRVIGDLTKPQSLDELIVPECVVVNLAFLSGELPAAQIAAARALLDACKRGGAKRLLHVSTAMVVGRTDEIIIDETAISNPLTDYERTKLAIEQALLREVGATCEVVVLRPTAVFGPGGRNLVKLATEVATGGPMSRRLKLAFHADRSMHLVGVESVVEAILVLATSAAAVDGEVYIVAADEAATNNYRDVEACLSRAFADATKHGTVVHLPHALRDWVLRRVRHVGVPSRARFSSGKLKALGYQAPVPFETAIDHYAKHLAAQFRQHGTISG
jgi:nucleoside-diphosphate-sugar epimerase